MKEHIFAHQLLARIYNDSKMWFAANMMLRVRKYHANKCLRLAATARLKVAQAISKVNTGRSFSDETRALWSQQRQGNKNSFYGKHHTEETKKIIGAKSRLKVMPEEARHKLSVAMKGRIFTKETRQKLSKAMRGKPKSIESVKKHYVPILQYSIGGQFIREWESLCSVSRELGINSTGISHCLSGKRRQAGGYVWRYK